MSHKALPFVFIVVFCAFWSGAADVSSQDSKSAPKSSSCVIVTSYASYRGVGYQHVVELNNKCTKRQVCDVSTNVDPDPAHSVTLEPNEEQEIVTRTGSPASAFSPRVICKAG